MIFYRGDSRSPETIRKQKGFQAKRPMTILQARQHLLSYCVTSTPLDLSRWIIASPKPEYISTAPDEGCGGYAHMGYVYKIEFNNLTERQFSDAFCGGPLLRRPNSLWPSVVSDGVTIGFSKTIVIKHKTDVKELTFFTEIPLANIVQYRASSERTFTAMQATKVPFSPPQIPSKVNRPKIFFPK